MSRHNYINTFFKTVFNGNEYFHNRSTIYYKGISYNIAAFKVDLLDYFNFSPSRSYCARSPSAII